MKISIVGTGAMGSVYAAHFGKAGHEVWAIDVWQAHLDAIDRGGLTVSGASGSFVVGDHHLQRRRWFVGSHKRIYRGCLRYGMTMCTW